MDFKPDNRPKLSFQNIKVGEKIKAKLIGITILPKSFLGLFYTELGYTKVIIGNSSKLNLKDALEYKGKDCWLKYKVQNLSDELHFTNFEIIWI
jgi:hypothetical protein